MCFRFLGGFGSVLGEIGAVSGHGLKFQGGFGLFRGSLGLFRVGFGLFRGAEQFVGTRLHRNPLEFRIVPGRFRFPVASGQFRGTSGALSGFFRASWAGWGQFEMQLENRHRPANFIEIGTSDFIMTEIACVKGVQVFGTQHRAIVLDVVSIARAFPGKHINHDKTSKFAWAITCAWNFAMFLLGCHKDCICALFWPRQCVSVFFSS